ncbi:hypothetical protein HPB49_010773 [Dermacentor silvarum]|uniref:Uncharacterized protein n=1 Tax=Dermacentor silvarum TaxID=543639 RepID=A0ACB8C326_DERSI|nr:hypothetical protein HPB49_010773 [Dermacentor silvarum]
MGDCAASGVVSGPPIDSGWIDDTKLWPMVQRSSRLTSFKESVLEEADSNRHIVKSWCQRGLKSFEAKCVICDLQKVVIEHLESFNLGRATEDIIVGCVERSITELPKEKLLCFFRDSPNPMKV